MTCILQVDRINKTYGNKIVVDNVSFEVNQGEIMGILGPNGAGKTTTIRMIMGITAPDEGELTFTFDGQKYDKSNGFPKSKIGYLPEERGLYKESRVLDVLLFLAGLKGVDKETAKPRILEWLEKFDLSKNINSKIEELSKGMAQKVQFIASVIHNPALVVLDEPFSGLDPVSQDVFKKEIKELSEKGTAVLLCSHQMNLVEETCNRIFLIYQGKKVLYGTLQEIKSHYGSYQVNILPRGDIGLLTESPYIEKYSNLGNRVLLTLKRNVQPAEFLATIPADAPIDELTITRIPLHDIFVQVAKGGFQ